jgi:hypothetical protein
MNFAALAHVAGRVSWAEDSNATADRVNFTRWRDILVPPFDPPQFDFGGATKSPQQGQRGLGQGGSSV